MILPATLFLVFLKASLLNKLLDGAFHQNIHRRCKWSFAKIHGTESRASTCYKKRHIDELMRKLVMWIKDTIHPQNWEKEGQHYKNEVLPTPGKK